MPHWNQPISKLRNSNSYSFLWLTSSSLYFIQQTLKSTIKDLLTRQDLVLKEYISYNYPSNYNYLASQKCLASKTLDICRHRKCKQFFDVDINEYLDILKGVGAQIVIWTCGKGVGGARVCALNHCSIAKCSKVAKWVNMLQNKSHLNYFKYIGPGTAFTTTIFFITYE